MSFISPLRSSALRSLVRQHRQLFNRSITLAAQRKQLATQQDLATIPQWEKSTQPSSSPIYALPSSCSSSAPSPSGATPPSPSQTAPTSINRTLNFNSFSAAFGFITRVGLLAARLSHHPELWNAGGVVRLRLTTDDSGGVVTALDVRMAQAIDRAAVECGEVTNQ